MKRRRCRAFACADASSVRFFAGESVAVGCAAPFRGVHHRGATAANRALHACKRVGRAGRWVMRRQDFSRGDVPLPSRPSGAVLPPVVRALTFVLPGKRGAAPLVGFGVPFAVLILSAGGDDVVHRRRSHLPFPERPSRHLRFFGRVINRLLSRLSHPLVCNEANGRSRTLTAAPGIGPQPSVAARVERDSHRTWHRHGGVLPWASRVALSGVRSQTTHTLARCGGCWSLHGARTCEICVLAFHATRQGLRVLARDRQLREVALLRDMRHSHPLVGFRSDGWRRWMRLAKQLPPCIRSPPRPYSVLRS